MSQDEFDDLIASFDGRHDIGEITTAFIAHGVIQPETEADRRNKARQIIGRHRKQKILQGRISEALVGLQEVLEDGTVVDFYIQPQHMTKDLAVLHVNQLYRKLKIHRERMYEFARYYIEKHGLPIQKRFPFAMPEGSI